MVLGKVSAPWRTARASDPARAAPQFREPRRRPRVFRTYDRGVDRPQGHSVTSRYMHAADAVLLAAADIVADKTAELMGDCDKSQSCRCACPPMPKTWKNGPLGQLSDLLVSKLYCAVDDWPPDHRLLEPFTLTQAVKIQAHLVAVIDMLDRPGGTTEEDWLLLTDKFYKLLVAVNTVWNCSVLLGKSKLKASGIKRASMMRKAKQPSNAARRLRLAQAIKDEAGSLKRVIATSEKFAGDVRPGVRARLGLEPDNGWPEISTIRTAAREIKRRHLL